jgi:hypothetical protein
MGEHDQTVLHDKDAPEEIGDDGRRFHPLGIDENPDVDYVAFSASSLVPVFRYSRDKLIHDAVRVHIRPFHVTKWESLYSSLFGTGVKPTRFEPNGVEPSFTPIIDESYRVVGHLGWINMSQICIFTAQGGTALDLQKAEKARLGERRKEILAERDAINRSPLFRRPAQPATNSPPPCRPSPTSRLLKPAFAFDQDTVGRDPVIWESEEVRHQNNFNFFLAAGGTALVGRAIAMDLWDSERDEMYWMEGYRCLTLVGPDGHLQGVLGVEKIQFHHESRNQRDLRLVLEVVDIALTIWMVIDLVTIPVALIRVGLWVAEKVEIQAIKFALNEAAKAALKAAEQEAKRALQLGAMAGPEAAAKEAFWRAASVTPRQFSEVEVKTWTAKIASRMKQLGIPEKNIGAKVRKFPPGKPKKMIGTAKIPGETGEAFNPTGIKRGSNLRSFADEYGVEEGGISVHGSVFERWEGFDVWNNALVEDRIDAIIAHEWMEFNELSHWETVELIEQSKLRISDKAKEILKFMRTRGKPLKALTEFPK